MENLGLTHKDRYSEKLFPSYFQVDEKVLVDFVDFFEKFSNYINFYNTNDDIDGTARTFIASDTTIMLIHISSFSEKTQKNKLDAILRNVEQDLAQLPLAFNLLYSLCSQVNNWKEITVDFKDFNIELEKLILSKFTGNLSRIVHFENDITSKIEYRKNNTTYLFMTEDMWEIDGYTPDAHEFASTNEKKLLEEICNEIVQLFNSLASSIALVVESAQQYLQKVTNAGSTQPHIALYMAFIEMYNYAKKDINKFTQRHLDYYYKKILRFENIPEIPDKVHLTFEMQDGIETYKLPNKTGVYAGQDKNGKDLIYKIDNELVVSTAKIEAVTSVVNDENTSGTVHKFFKHIFLNHNINKNVFKEDFEGEKIGDLGFALATSFLKLNEGDRTITFTFNLQRHSFEKFITLYKTKILSDVNINIYDINDFVFQLFSFGYSTTDKNGEAEIFILPKKNVKTAFKKNNYGDPLNQFIVKVDVSAVHPPISACLLSEFELAKDKGLPLCYFFIDSSKMIYYNFYKEIVIEKVEISVHVEGIRDLKVQNQYGSLDTEFPFEPFGATPLVGSTFYLGHETIFSQKINDLQIVMDWKDVPMTDNGFAEYYHGYPDVVNNQAFKVSVSALKDRKWIPEENKQIIHLFDDINTEELEDKDIMPANNIRVIDNLDLNKINDAFKGNPKINVNEAYSRISTNGFLKFSFVYPASGFGHLEYPKLLAKQALRSVKKGATIENELNEPWIPTLNSISINYESSIVIDFNKQDKYNKTCYYHLKPFGSKLVSEPVGNEINIIPYYDKGTELYLAIKNFNENEILTIFVNIDNLVSTASETTNISWSFLMHDNWNEIFDNSILSDTTNNLSTSGIVTFDFTEYDKEFFNLKNLTARQSMPEGFFYIRIKTDTGENFVNRINYISCHGVTATFFNNQNVHQYLDSGLPVGTISTFAEDHPDIKQIKQPFASFAGAKEESIDDFRVRVSERLRHKDRGVTKWDIEHIILQEFKDISKVICLNNTNAEVEKEPGNVLLVVIPNIDNSTTLKILQPRSSEITLKNIHDFLSQRISPFVKFEIRNPIYEQVQVKFQIQFRDGYNPRYYLQVVNQELREFLNPWIRENSNVDVTASDNIYSVHIVYFLEKREYVDYVSNVSVFHVINHSIVNLDTAHDNNVVLKPTTDISIFVSAPEHIIEVVGGETLHDSLGTLAVGKDFSTEYIAEKKFYEGVGKSEIEVDFEVENRRIVEDIFEEYILEIDF